VNKKYLLPSWLTVSSLLFFTPYLKQIYYFMATKAVFLSKCLKFRILLSHKALILYYLRYPFLDTVCLWIIFNNFALLPNTFIVRYRILRLRNKSLRRSIYTVNSINIVQSSLLLIVLFACYDGIYHSRLTK
jgi:hypothetical protein